MSAELCPICEKGILLEQNHLHPIGFHPIHRYQEFVTLEHSICDNCGEWITTPEQSRANKKIIIAAKNLLVEAI